MIRVYTTRPDTLFGATYMVLAPEHPLVDQITTPDSATPSPTYREQAARKSDLDRTDLAKTKTGVFTGAYAINPVTGKPIPIWIADYVLMGYGTGAIMAVPGHDERDFAFAKTFDLPIVAVVMPPDAWLKAHQGDSPGTDDVALLRAAYRTHPGAFTEAYCDDGIVDQVGEPRVQHRRPADRGGQAAITAWLAEQGLGRQAVNYKLRDWLFRRQRYWGEPFPIVLDEDDRVRTPCPSPNCPCCCPNSTTSSPRGKPEPPLGKATRLGALLRALPPRDQHHAPVGRLVLVLPPLPRPEERRSSLGPGEGEVLDAGRPLRRRRRARRAAPALQPVLAQGAVRPRPRQHDRAVPEAGQPGDDPGRDGVHRLTRTPRELGLGRRCRGARGRPCREGIEPAVP